MSMITTHGNGDYNEIKWINNINEDLVCVNKLQESEVLERLRAEIQQRQSNGFGAVLLVVVMSVSFENYGLLEEN